MDDLSSLLEPDETVAALKQRSQPRYLRTSIPPLYLELPKDGGITVKDVVEISGDKRGILEVLYDITVWSIIPAFIGGMELVAHYIDVENAFSIHRIKALLVNVYNISSEKIEICEKDFLYICLSRLYVHKCHTPEQISNVFGQFEKLADGAEQVLLLSDVTSTYWLHRAAMTTFSYSRFIRDVSKKCRMFCFIGKSLLYGRRSRAFMHRIDNDYESIVKYRLHVDENAEEDTFNVYYKRGTKYSSPYKLHLACGNGLRWDVK